MNRPKRLLRALLLCAVLVIELVPAFSDGPITIALVLSRDIAPYREALRGFKSELESSRQKFRYFEYNVELSLNRPDALVERIRSRGPDMVVTLGSAATNLIVERIREVPVVFSLVLPSSGSKSLEDLRASQGNITGATMEIPLATQFGKIREVIPTAKKVAVLYDPDVTGPLVEGARVEAEKAGLELVALPVSSEKDVVRSMRELDDSIDVLWSVADSTVFSPQGLRHILLSTLRTRLPFVGLSPSFVKAGALLALSCDYQDVGRQSGELAVRILEGEGAGDIPIVVPREVSLSLNLRTARQIQVAISEEVAQAAAQLF